LGEAFYCSLGYRFAFVWDDPGVGALGCRLIDEFAQRIRPGAAGSVAAAKFTASTERRSSGPWYTLQAGDELIAGSPDPERIAEQLMWRAAADAIAKCDRFLLAHAGAVASPHGDGVLLLGDSGAGKTTLVAALVQKGYGFLSDEAGVIDPADGRVHPWPRPLGFKPGTQTLARFGQALGGSLRGRDGSAIVIASGLRPGALAESCHVRHVVDYRYEGGASTSLRELSGAEAVVAIGRSTPNLRLHGQRGLEVIAELVEGSTRHRMVSGDLDEAVRALDDLVQR
jgi:hypothetical protein